MQNRMKELLKGFEFTAGKDAIRDDGYVQVWVHCEEGWHLISLWAGSMFAQDWLQFRKVVLTRQDGFRIEVVTNRRGHIQLKTLPEGTYKIALVD